jgi:hypothetical protein
MSASKQWYGNGGRVVLELHGAALVKRERSKDRLRIMQCMGHAIDEATLQEALRLGATEIFINEDNRRLVWVADLKEILPKSQIKVIAGIRRRCFDLRRFELVEGIAPAWYPKQNQEASQAEQLSLFEGVSP